MNRFGATVTAGALLLSLAACGSGNKPAAVDTPLAPPSSTPTPTPKKADPTATAKTQVLAAYANFIVLLDKGYRVGGVTYPYATFMSDGALQAIKDQITFVKGFHQATVTGSSRLVESRITALSLSTKPQTATVTACVDDRLKAVSRKNGKVLSAQPGPYSRVDKLKLVKGKWMVYDTYTDDASYGCSK